MKAIYFCDDEDHQQLLFVCDEIEAFENQIVDYLNENKLEDGFKVLEVIHETTTKSGEQYYEIFYDDGEGNKEPSPNFIFVNETKVLVGDCFLS